jgi:hypothetical protein
MLPSFAPAALGGGGTEHKISAHFLGLAYNAGPASWRQGFQPFGGAIEMAQHFVVQQP